MKQFVLPELPYALDGLAPHISKETLEYHYGKHHAGYVKKLNAATEGTDYLNMPIEEIIQRADNQGLFNNAAQTFNHAFYWLCLKPNASDEIPKPSAQLEAALKESFGSVEAFVEEFTKTGLTHFGSGWAWLLKKADGSLAIEGLHDADTPVREGHQPLLTLDVWEHAYYIDYRNGRGNYIDAFWKLVNWDFVEQQLLSDGGEPLLVAQDV